MAIFFSTQYTKYLLCREKWTKKVAIFFNMDLDSQSTRNIIGQKNWQIFSSGQKKWLISLTQNHYKWQSTLLASLRSANNKLCSVEKRKTLLTPEIFRQISSLVFFLVMRCFHEIFAKKS